MIAVVGQLVLGRFLADIGKLTLCMDITTTQVLQSSVERSLLKTWKNIQMIPKGNQKRTSWNQKGTKKVPKVNQTVSKMHEQIRIEKR